MAKRALCIGINNYPGTHMDLAGCVNDANAWEAELKGRGFKVTKMLDEQATKAAMAAAFKEVIGGAAKGDLVVITYSGHGTYVPDASGDEVDGLDEGLCPYDIQTGGGALLDDEIHALFAARKSGVRLVLISDSCHSGTVTRAAQPDDAEPEAPRPRFLPMGNWLPADQLPRAGAGKPALPAVKGTSPLAKAMSRKEGDLLLAGCQEGPDHFSYDAHIAGKPTGAFTYYALKALRGLPANATYDQWHAAITPGSLPSASYKQTPQIVGDAKARQSPIFA
jgi:hypothetical protein